MRLELPNGDWVDLVDRLNYGQQQRISAGENTTAEGVAAMITNWSLRDVNDDPIPLPMPTLRGIPTETLDAIPLDAFVLIAEAAGEIVERSILGPPKASGETSSASPQAQRSASRRSSPTPTSLRSMDGAGQTFSPPRPT